MNVPVFWMFDPEADSIKSPFVHQPHYNDLENRIRELEAALAEAHLQRDSWKRIAESGLGLTAETPDDAWLCVCGLTVKKRYQCLCGGSEDNSRADRFTVTGNETLTAEEFGTADDTEVKS